MVAETKAETVVIILSTHFEKGLAIRRLILNTNGICAFANGCMKMYTAVTKRQERFELNFIHKSFDHFGKRDDYFLR